MNFADVIQLTDEHYSPGSLGTCNLQFQVDVENNHKVQWLANEIELVVLPRNNGTLCLEPETSSTFISLLTKQESYQVWNKSHILTLNFIGWLVDQVLTIIQETG